MNYLNQRSVSLYGRDLGGMPLIDTMASPENRQCELCITEKDNFFSSKYEHGAHGFLWKDVVCCREFERIDYFVKEARNENIFLLPAMGTGSLLEIMHKQQQFDQDSKTEE